MNWFLFTFKKSHCLTSKEKQQRILEYEKFIFKQNCPINHSGSVGSIEASGVVECFQSSVQNWKLWYTQLIGDGDSKTHPSILVVDSYFVTPVEKPECIEHIQKRIGSRLCNLRSKHEKN